MFNSLKPLREKKVIIAAHRGTSGGNIVQNTTLAYINALNHGADIVEVDVIRSADGKFYAFHNGQEEIVFGEKLDIQKMNSNEISNQKMRNAVGEYIEQKVESLSTVLKNLSQKCFINIDRSWFYWDTFLEELSKSSILDQIILKSPSDKIYLDQLSNSKINIKFMPIVKTLEDLDLVLSYPTLNVVAVELVFDTLDNSLLCEATIRKIKDKGILLWVNTLTLDDVTTLSGGLDDDLAIRKGGEFSWGKLIDLGFDIIQTDWPLLLEKFLENKK